MMNVAMLVGLAGVLGFAVGRVRSLARFQPK